jgi:tripartite-type tricarboxylate transporter receptor subunit TctC
MGGTSSLAIAPGLYAKLPYDPLKDLTSIINVAHVPYALAVNPTVPARNVKVWTRRDPSGTCAAAGGPSAPI